MTKRRLVSNVLLRTSVFFVENSLFLASSGLAKAKTTHVRRNTLMTSDGAYLNAWALMQFTSAVSPLLPTLILIFVHANDDHAHEVLSAQCCCDIRRMPPHRRSALCAASSIERPSSSDGIGRRKFLFQGSGSL